MPTPLGDHGCLANEVKDCEPGHDESRLCGPSCQKMSEGGLSEGGQSICIDISLRFASLVSYSTRK